LVVRALFIVNLFLLEKWLISITTGMLCSNWGNKSTKNAWKDGRTRTGWFNMTFCQWTLLCQCSIITGRFCIIWGNKPPKTYETMNQDLLIYCDNMLMCTSLSVQQFWPPKICLWSHTLLICLIRFLKIFSCFWESNCSIPFPVCPWLQEKLLMILCAIPKVSCSGASSSGKNAGCRE